MSAATHSASVSRKYELIVISCMQFNLWESRDLDLSISKQKHPYSLSHDELVLLLFQCLAPFSGVCCKLWTHYSIIVLLLAFDFLLLSILVLQMKDSKLRSYFGLWSLIINNFSHLDRIWMSHLLPCSKIGNWLESFRSTRFGSIFRDGFIVSFIRSILRN